MLRATLKMTMTLAEGSLSLKRIAELEKEVYLPVQPFPGFVVTVGDDKTAFFLRVRRVGWDERTGRIIIDTEPIRCLDDSDVERNTELLQSHGWTVTNDLKLRHAEESDTEEVEP